MRKVLVTLLKIAIVGAILTYLVTSVAYYEITPEAVEDLSKEIHSLKILEGIKSLQGNQFSDEEAMVSALQEAIGQEATQRYQEIVLLNSANARLNFKKLFIFFNRPYFLVALLLTIACWVVPLAGLRWWLLLRSIGLQVPFFRALLLTWIGNFFNTTLPGAISGDVVKGYYIIKAQVNEGKTRAFTTLLIDRFVGLFGLIVMAFVAMLFGHEVILSKPALRPLAGMISALFAGTVVFYLIVLFPFKEGKDPFIRLFNKLPGRNTTVKVYQAFKVYQDQKATLVYTLGISVIIHSTIAFIFLMIANMIDIKQLDAATQLFIMPIGLITIAIPVAPGGLGIGHAAFESLYHMMGVSGGADVFNLFIIIQLAVFLLGGIPYFFYSNEYKVPEEAEKEMVEMEKGNGES